MGEDYKLSTSHIDRIRLHEDGAESRAPTAIFSIGGRWRQLNLTTQFAIVASIVIGITMAVLGTWVGSRIESSVIRHTALAAALYMDRFVEPLVQDLASTDKLSDKSLTALRDMITNARVGKSLLDVKIWRPDGTVVYSSQDKLIGQHYPLEGNLAVALQGNVGAEFDELEAEENISEKAMQRHILEIYAPVRETGTQRIIGVAEFYQVSDQLASELAWARAETIFGVVCLALLMLGALSGIVRRGSRTITAQQIALSERVEELSRLLTQNGELRQRVAEANRRSSEHTEHFLRRVSAELHDGPVQLIGLGLLRLDGIVPRPKDGEKAPPNKDLEIIRGALKDALSEIRDLSHGLAMPELEDVTFTGALEIAISNHERRSGTLVDVVIGEEMPESIPASIKTCAYRFVQEGLNNAFRHADGAGQRVETSWDGQLLTIEVSDRGPGITEKPQTSSKSGLGLPGLRDRIEALGGTMSIVSLPDSGTRLKAVFSLIDGEA